MLTDPPACRRRRRIAQLKTVQGLADDTTEDDTATWLKRHKKGDKARAKAAAAAAKRAAEEAEQDEHAAAVYNSRDLAGLKIGHAKEDFVEGQTILTLADGDVLDDDGEDTLVNPNMIDDAGHRNRVEAKKRGTGEYKGYDDDEFGDDVDVAGGVGANSVLKNRACFKR